MAYSNVALSPDGAPVGAWQTPFPPSGHRAVDVGDKITAERLHALGLVNRLSNPAMLWAQRCNWQIA